MMTQYIRIFPFYTLLLCLACCLTHTAGQASIETPPSTREGKQLYYIPQSSEIFQQNPWGFGGFPGPISLHSYGEPNVFPGSMGSGQSVNSKLFFGLLSNLGTTTTCPPPRSCPSAPVCGRQAACTACPAAVRADITTCGTGANTAVSAAATGTFTFTTTTAAQACNYRIVAAPPSTKVKITCANLGGATGLATLSSPGGVPTPLMIGTTGVTSTINVADVSIITGGAAPPYIFTCSWTAV